MVACVEVHDQIAMMSLLRAIITDLASSQTRYGMGFDATSTSESNKGGSLSRFELHPP